MSDSPRVSASRAVFLSYASQDAAAAKRICDSLRSSGVEVWFDSDGGLEHGDEWDAKIRRQIKDCVLFIPLISATTQERQEGYFRLEWELAAQRAMSIASGVPFILPVVIDDTREPDALVPDRFRAVQWTRLRHGEVPPEVLLRFLKLWSHRVGVLRDEGTKATAATGPVGLAPGGKASGGRTKKNASLIAIAAVGLLAGVGWWLVRVRDRPGTQPPTPVATAPAATGSVAATQSEARQLATKAFVLLQKMDVVREDLALAEDYCQRALKLDSTDGEVWAIYSQVDSVYVYRGWDTTLERREQTRVMAERAIRLAPDSVQARLAQAGAWSAFGVNSAETEKILRDIVKEQPDNKTALKFLAITVLKRGALDECLALNERSASLPGGDPLALYNSARYLWQRSRQAEAYATLQRSLAQKPFSSSLVLRTIMEMVWHGDLATAEETLQQIPESLQLEDRANYTAGLLRFYQRRETPPWRRGVRSRGIITTTFNMTVRKVCWSVSRTNSIIAMPPPRSNGAQRCKSSRNGWQRRRTIPRLIITSPTSWPVSARRRPPGTPCAPTKNWGESNSRPRLRCRSSSLSSTRALADSTKYLRTKHRTVTRACGSTRALTPCAPIHASKG